MSAGFVYPVSPDVEVEVRQFSAEKADLLLAAINAVCAEGRWMEALRYQPTLAWEHSLQNPQCPHHVLLVAEVGDQVIGWCRLFPLPDCQDRNSTAELGIGLLPAYRDRGLGTAIVLYVCQAALRLGIDTMTLSTRMDNRRAIHVFKRCGFVERTGEKCGIMTMVRHLIASSPLKEPQR